MNQTILFKSQICCGWNIIHRQMLNEWRMLQYLRLQSAIKIFPTWLKLSLFVPIFLYWKREILNWRYGSLIFHQVLQSREVIWDGSVGVWVLIGFRCTSQDWRFASDFPPQDFFFHRNAYFCVFRIFKFFSFRRFCYREQKIPFIPKMEKPRTPPPSPKYIVYRVYSYSGIVPKIIARKFEMGLHIHGCIASVFWGPSLWSCKLVVIWPSCSCLPYIVLSSPSVSSTSRERPLCISI